MSSTMLRFKAAGVKSTSRALAVLSSRTASSWVRTSRTTRFSLTRGAVSCAFRALRVIHDEDTTKIRHELLGQLQPLGDASRRYCATGPVGSPRSELLLPEIPAVLAAGGSLADRGYGRRAGSSIRLMIPPHVQVIHTHSSSAPPSSSPQSRCASRKTTRLARRWLSSIQRRTSTMQTARRARSIESSRVFAGEGAGGGSNRGAP